MLVFQLPTDRIEYLQLSLHAAGPGLVAWWGTQESWFTVATWNDPNTSPVWKTTGRPMALSPDGEWVSKFDRTAGEVTVSRVGERRPVAILPRSKKTTNTWTAVAPDGVAIAWKEEPFTVVLSLPDGKPVARIKTGFGYDLRFSPGGRWLTEVGEKVFRVFDRTDGYRVFARIKTPRFVRAEVADGPTAVVFGPTNDTVTVWDLSTKTAVAALQTGGSVYALAISADGQRVLTGNVNGDVALWDAAGARLRDYAWGVRMPIAAAFSRDGTRAAVGGTDGKIVVWDRDD